MDSQIKVYLENLDSLILSKHLLNHDFYQAWSRGELSLDCLKEYAKEYYHHVKAFPTYLSALHSRTDDPVVRQALLKNLVEEEGGSPNHPDLWKQFAIALGVNESDLKHHLPNQEITNLINAFKEICTHRPVVDGLAALYAYESQIPAICISKIEGLKAHYGMSEPKGWEYFRVHIMADKEHAEEERQLLEGHVNSLNIEGVKLATNKILDALNDFLTGLCHRYNIACT